MLSNVTEEGASFCVVDPSDVRFSSVWSRHVATAVPALELSYLEVLRKSVDRSAHFIAAALPDGRIVATAYLSIARYSLALGLGVRVLLLGGARTNGKAYWFDPECFSYERFIDSLLRYLRTQFRHSYLVLRDFVPPKDTSALQTNAQRFRCVNLYCFSRSWLPLAGVMTYEAFLARLPARKRRYLHKVEQVARTAELRTELLENFESLVPQIYPLYLNVSRKARESKAAPLPEEYFALMAGTPGAKLLLVRMKERPIGFVLLYEAGSVLQCLYCGMDHSVSREVNLWYVVVIGAVQHAISSNLSAVDLGSTNVSMKQKFQAETYEVWVSIRHRSVVGTLLTGRIIRKAFRRIYAGDSHRDE